MRNPRFQVFVWVVLTTILVTTSGCTINPATGRRQLSLISEQQEIAMGKENDKAIEAQMGLYADDELQVYVDEIGQQLAALSERPHLPWEFHVIDDPTVNAFALPGGYIYVTRGILAHFNLRTRRLFADSLDFVQHFVGILGTVFRISVDHPADQVVETIWNVGHVLRWTAESGWLVERIFGLIVKRRAR